MREQPDLVESMKDELVEAGIPAEEVDELIDTMMEELFSSSGYIMTFDKESGLATRFQMHIDMDMSLFARFSPDDPPPEGATMTMDADFEIFDLRQGLQPGAARGSARRHTPGGTRELDADIAVPAASEFSDSGRRARLTRGCAGEQRPSYHYGLTSVGSHGAGSLAHYLESLQFRGDGGLQRGGIGLQIDDDHRLTVTAGDTQAHHPRDGEQLHLVAVLDLADRRRSQHHYLTRGGLHGIGLRHRPGESSLDVLPHCEIGEPGFHELAISPHENAGILGHGHVGAVESSVLLQLALDEDGP